MRHGLATLFLGVSLALAYGFPGNSVTRAVRASTPTSTTWSFELPEDLSPIKRSTLRAQLSSAVNRHHTSWASAVDIHGLPGGDRPADGLLRPCARPNRDQIRPRDHEIDFCITPQVVDTDGVIDLDVARVMSVAVFVCCDRCEPCSTRPRGRASSYVHGACWRS